MLVNVPSESPANVVQNEVNKKFWKRPVAEAGSSVVAKVVTKAKANQSIKSWKRLVWTKTGWCGARKINGSCPHAAIRSSLPEQL